MNRKYVSGRLVHDLRAEGLGVGQATKKPAFVTTLFMAYVVLWGCGPKVEPGMIPVTGQVTLAGKPLQEAAIYFKGDDGFSNTARIDGGKFRSAMKPGAYSIAVIAQEELFDERGISTGFRQLIPMRYFTTASSGITATIDSAHRTVALDLAP
jgi:hypothetical protein